MEENENYSDQDYPHHPYYTQTPGARNRIWLPDGSFEDLGTGLTADIPPGTSGRRNRPCWKPRNKYKYKERICNYCGKAEPMGPRCTICKHCRKHNQVYLAEQKAKLAKYSARSAAAYKAKLLAQSWEPNPGGKGVRN